MSDSDDPSPLSLRPRLRSILQYAFAVMSGTGALLLAYLRMYVPFPLLFPPSISSSSLLESSRFDLLHWCTYWHHHRRRSARG